MLTFRDDIATQLIVVWVVFAVLALGARITLRGRFRAGTLIEIVLRVLAVGAALLALLEPTLERSTPDASVAVLTDISESIEEGLGEALLARSVSLATSTSELRFIPFAGTLAPLSFAAGDVGTFNEMRTRWQKLDIGQTDLERALGELRSVSESTRVIILSDGRATRGDVESIVPQLVQSGVRVFPIVPEILPPPGEQVQISNLYAPLLAPAKRSVEVRVSIKNTTSVIRTGTLEVTQSGKVLIKEAVSIPPGREALVVAASDPAQEGITPVTAAFTPDDKVFPPSQQTRFVAGEARERVLLISGGVDDARPLEEVLRDEAYQLSSLIAQPRIAALPELEKFSSVIFNNVALSQLPAGTADAIERYVKAGHGFMMLGGNRSFGLGGYLNTAIDALLPVQMLPPEAEEKRLNIAVELVIDKSGSMAQEQKLDYTKEAARQVVRNLKDEDFIGILAFDTGPWRVLPVSPVAQVRERAEERISRITGQGSTQLFWSLDEARRGLEGVPAGRKHMIVLTDGQLNDAGSKYIDAVQQMRLVGITVSTILVGAESDFGFLRTLAEAGGGGFYQVRDPREIPRIFLQDVKIKSGEMTLQERQDYPVRPGPGELVSTTLRAFPPLLGFVDTRSKRAAILELVLNAGIDTKPLLASWEYHTGKVIAFTSDANGRWSRQWLGWPRFRQFWTELVDAVRNRNTSSQEQIQFDLRHSVDSNKLRLDLSIYNNLSGDTVAAEVLTPNGKSIQVPFVPVVRGRYEATVSDPTAGRYEIRPRHAGGHATGEFTPVAINLSGELFGERRNEGVNIDLLASLAKMTGGKVNPSAQELSAAATPIVVKTPLRAWFLLLAVLFVVLEIIAREIGLKFSSLQRIAIPPASSSIVNGAR